MTNPNPLQPERRTIQEYFIDWYGEAFGYGYGTGDVYYCKALVEFFNSVKPKDGGNSFTYDYEELEKAMGAAEAWFTINELCKQDLIDYGTSPRYAWLSYTGEQMYQFLKGKTADELYELVNVDSDYIHCYKDYCNHTELKDKGCLSNPFWFEGATG